jgi:regulatory protein
MDSSDQFSKYLDKAFHFLSYRPRSEKEIRNKLLIKKAPQDIIERVITSLKENNFLDDRKYARWFVENRLRFNPKGQRIIKMELKQKGVDSEIIEEAINSLSTNEPGELPNSDLESAKKLVEKKLPRYKNLERQEIYNKLGAFLARRGFGWDTIKKSIDDGLSDEV